jgi:excisionase family DNA binding protein
MDCNLLFKWYQVDVIISAMIPKLLTVIETCEALRISRTKLYHLVENGDLKPIKIGKKVLFDEKDLMKFLERSKSK